MLTTYLNDDIGLIMSSEIKACLGGRGGGKNLRNVKKTS